MRQISYSGAWNAGRVAADGVMGPGKGVPSRLIILFFILLAPPMTNEELNFQGMALNTLQLLTDQRPQWEPLYKKLLPDYLALQTALGRFDDVAQLRGGSGSVGYKDAKDLAEIAALDAAITVLRGLKALYLDGNHPGLATLAKHSRSSLDDLRGLTQVAALEELHRQALPLADALEEEMVSAADLQKLRDATAAFKPLLGSPRRQVVAGTLLRDDAVQHLGDARKALKRLDVRVPNLSGKLPALAKEYARQRQIVDAGHGPGTPPEPKG